MTALRVRGLGVLLPSVTAPDDPSFPDRPVHAVDGFDVRERLGRRGTSFFDRTTALAVAACADALRDAGVDAGAQQPQDRIGVVLATTLGSFRSTSDFTRETLVQERPYLVNPMLFPNTVMNCAAGQSAIRLGLRGVNATVAGGPVAFLHALRYAADVLARGYADLMVVGAAEELSPHRVWSQVLTRGGGGAACGESAAAFVVGRDDDGSTGGTGTRILAAAAGYGPDGRRAEALSGCVRRALDRAGVAATEVDLVVTAETGPDDHGQFEAATRALGHRPRHRQVTAAFGDCDAATPAVGLAQLILNRRARPEKPGTTALLVAEGLDGAAAAALVRSPQCR
ncbi:beta-ketoacyl synthase N-terminal-like domain-containing protein [Micromonospora sp. CP22]|uniref:beta-ketoacyl synthase N-terminal-like domain-containing protein n=1 Tax=Micromonospora sp. CP22 TaxID=2580517 RepID=UPI001320AB84|nr:beta-ketoacyl synthase N-terminal-like domain-containing protein [Micromonospora sp. CP22]MTK01487.1 beta-ketoacyl synthase [Micromonospora sp. CP22]